MSGAEIRSIPTRNTKRRLKGLRASHTPGKTKGDNCKTDTQKKFFACNVKAYKHSDYDVWNAKFRSMNKMTGGPK
jgi:hypothetical protein